MRQAAWLAAMVLFASPPVGATPTPPANEKTETPAPDTRKEDAPKVDVPKADAPTVDAPKADVPKTEVPKAEVPKPDVPKADAFKNEDLTFARYREVVLASGRKFDIDAPSFAAMRQRRPAMLDNVRRYLKERLGEVDENVMRAFAEVPREYFHYHYQNDNSFSALAYETAARPYAIGFGSALSDYLGQAYMTQLAKVKPDSTVLEIGTGSGYQISILSRLAKKAYSIEIIEPLGKGTANLFKPLGFDNVSTRVGDGFFGWPEVEGGFDVIMVTCVAQYVPPALFEQLKPGGRLIIPIGQPFRQGQILYVYTKEADGRITSRRDVGVYFIPMTGKMFTPPPRPPAAADSLVENVSPPAAPTPAPAPAAAPAPAGTSGTLTLPPPARPSSPR
jgi:protein-L-isoaspartate(D-aspartate) O-methyltransferase